MKDLTKGNIYKTFLIFAVPMILAGFLSQAYSIIDTVIAGRILSSDGLAAIGSTSAFIQFFSSVFWGYGNGFSIYIARLFGAGDFKRLKQALCTNYIVLTIIIVILSVIIVLLKEPIFEILKIAPSIRDEAGVYFSIYMLGIVFVLYSYHGVYIMSALGSGAYPLIMSAVSTVLHIVGNLFAVKVLGWGVGGIAISTVVSAAIVNFLYYLEIRRCFKLMGVADYKIKFNFDFLHKSIKFSIPTTIQQMVMYLASVVVSPMVNGIGSAASAAYVICLKIYDVNATTYQNSAKTVSNYEAQSIGAKKFKNIKKGLYVGFLQGLLFELPVLIFSVLYAKDFCAFFLPKGYKGDGLEMAIVFVKYFLPFILFNLINNLFHSFYRGVASMRSLVVSTCIGSASRIIATFFAAKYYGMNGVYMGWVISWIVECLYSLAVYFSGKWKPKGLNLE